MEHSLKCRYSLFDGRLSASPDGLLFERDSFGTMVEVERWGWTQVHSFRLEEELMFIELVLELKQGQKISFSCSDEEADLRQWLNAVQAVRFQEPGRALKDQNVVSYSSKKEDASSAKSSEQLQNTSDLWSKKEDVFSSFAQREDPFARNTEQDFNKNKDSYEDPYEDYSDEDSEAGDIFENKQEEDRQDQWGQYNTDSNQSVSAFDQIKQVVEMTTDTTNREKLRQELLARKNAVLQSSSDQSSSSTLGEVEAEDEEESPGCGSCFLRVFIAFMIISFLGNAC